MNTQKPSHKFPPLKNNLILRSLSGSLESLLSNLGNITNSYSIQPSKNQEIKYFNFTDIINGFSNLQPNWDSYHADAISKNAINTAMETLNYLFSIGTLSNDIEVNVCPMRDGGIQYEFDSENICAELEINPNSELTFLLFDEDGNMIKKKQLLELSELSTLLEEVEYA